ncbi:energy-coupling factor ABC transporter ATP-binding protein [Finegoldia magna]|uniref:energy-coupling factor ABC transporter ATP-binding protein n=1 Tax=Finegoldia magna TaxID=1260 RepID=UPI000B91C587|nr:ABC transporter ATP-binding protein [Finegoldia magna]MCC3310370.1 energy-coupling factor ABC transporter ATP-binding protein [Finegoldia magna]OXZ27928.1 ABC transporter ATP-binding protein [Finegoldia magna]OXZ36189.1 ABC transporter ATP-binding protein [Finegoldia magna]PWV47995.1 energy-coupling factor transport system ATP-binding protein [Finegoldia magna]
MSKLEFKNVSFTYPNGFKAINDLNLVVNSSEKVAIVGQNGAGKSTCAKLMNGLLRPNSGEILLDGKNTKDMTTAQISRKVGYVFQNPNDQIFNSTVYDEVAFSLRALKVDEDEMDKRVRQACEICELSEYLDDHPYDLPFSTRKFITIAITIANDCDIFIFDEPTAGQDAYSMSCLKRVIDHLHDLNKTIITITHDMEFVVENFDRVVVMSNKEIIKDADKKEVFDEDEILQKAYIQPPVVKRLCNSINLNEKLLSVDDFVDYIKNFGGAND